MAKKAQTKAKKKAVKAKPAKKKARSAPTKKASAKAAKKAPAKKAPAKKAKKKAAKPAKAAKSGKATVAKKKAKAAAKRKVSKSAKPKRTRPKSPAARRRAARKEFAAFRKLLLARHNTLMQSYIRAQGVSRGPADDGTEDYIDYAVSSYAREFSLSLSELERAQLELVEGALKRIDLGQYGRCLNCDKTVPPKRLEVEPWARYCIPCQELDDRGLLERSDLAEDEAEEGEEADALLTTDTDDGDAAEAGEAATKGEAITQLQDQVEEADVD